MNAILLIGGLLTVAAAFEFGGRFGAALVIVIVLGMALTAQRRGMI